MNNKLVSVNEKVKAEDVLAYNCAMGQGEGSIVQHIVSRIIELESASPEEKDKRLRTRTTENPISGKEIILLMAECWQTRIVEEAIVALSKKGLAESATEAVLALSKAGKVTAVISSVVALAKSGEVETATRAVLELTINTSVSTNIESILAMAKLGYRETAIQSIVCLASKKYKGTASEAAIALIVSSEITEDKEALIKKILESLSAYDDIVDKIQARLLKLMIMVGLKE